MTRKSSSYYASIKQDRNAWKASLPQVCMKCGCGGQLEIHEILRRSRCKEWWFRANALLLCQADHVRFDASNQRTMTEALAIKMLRDPQNYDLDEWLTARDPRAMGFITQDEVSSAVDKILAVEIEESVKAIKQSQRNTR